MLICLCCAAAADFDLPATEKMRQKTGFKREILLSCLLPFHIRIKLYMHIGLCWMILYATFVIRLTAALY